MLKSVLNKFAMNEKVTSDMIMGDIIRLHPEVVDTLISQGMHCLGCPSSQQESLAKAWTRKSLLKPSTLPLKRTNSKRRTYHERIFRTHPFLVIQ